MMQLSLVTAFLDGGKLYLRLLRKKNYVCHKLQSVNHRRDILFALQTRKLGLGAVCLANVIFHSLHVAAISKEGVARRADLVRIGIVNWFQQLACQPVAVTSRKRQTLYVCPKFVCCNSCHNFKYLISACKDSANRTKNQIFLSFSEVPHIWCTGGHAQGDRPRVHLKSARQSEPTTLQVCKRHRPSAKAVQPRLTPICRLAL